MKSSSHPYCQCQLGYSGPHCEKDSRCPITCQNEGVCIRDLSTPYQYSCSCPMNYYGQYCENKRSNPTCPYLQCERSSRDQVCDQQCNIYECNWDGGDCSLNWTQPWANCSAPVPCWNLFENGYCDKECDNPGCLFDSFECRETPVTFCKYVTPFSFLSLVQLC